MLERTSRWLLHLNEFGITITTYRGPQSQALSDLLDEFLPKGYEPSYEEVLGKDVTSADTDEWHLTFDRSSTNQGGGARVILSVPMAPDFSRL